MGDQTFSVVILHYNQLEFWRAAIDSVLAQSYPEIEIVFADDGTSGFDITEVERYVERNNGGNITNCKTVSQKENIGTTRCLNAADALCTGKYITRFSADDALANPEVLNDYANALDDLDEDVLGVFGHVIGCDESLNPSDVRQASMVQPDECARMGEMSSAELFRHMALCGGNRIAPGASAYKLGSLRKALPLDEDYRIIEDWPFSLRIARSGWRMQYLHKPTLRYRFGGVSTSMKVNDIRAVYLADLVAIYESEIIPHLDKFEYSDRASVLARYLGIARPGGKPKRPDQVNRLLSNNDVALSVIDALSASVQELSEWARILEGIKDDAEQRAKVLRITLDESTAQLESSLYECNQNLAKAKKKADTAAAKNERLLKSPSWRIGRTITWLPRKVKHLLVKQ